jgi:hypothetical protein
VTHVLRIETANSVWHFDEERSMFRRAPREAEEVFAATDDWEPYFGLEIDADTGAFTVLLDPDGARRYRSFRIDTEGAADEATAGDAPDELATTEEMRLLGAAE